MVALEVVVHRKLQQAMEGLVEVLCQLEDLVEAPCQLEALEEVLWYDHHQLRSMLVKQIWALMIEWTFSKTLNL